MKLSKHPLSLGLLLLLCGCGRVHETHLFQSSMALKWPGAEGMDHVYIGPGIAALRNSRVVVELQDPEKSLSRQASAAAQWDWRRWHVVIESAVADALYQSRVFADVAARSDPGEMPDPDFVLVVGLTEWDRGSPIWRYMVGWGTGRTRMQWEGELHKPGADKSLMAFADARDNPGGPSTFPLGFRALYSEKLLLEDLNGALIDLQTVVRAKTHVVQALRDPLDPHPKYHPRPFASPPAPIASLPAKPLRR